MNFQEFSPISPSNSGTSKDLVASSIDDPRCWCKSDRVPKYPSVLLGPDKSHRKSPNVRLKAGDKSADGQRLWSSNSFGSSCKCQLSGVQKG